MIPLLFPPSHQGAFTYPLGPLSEATACTVREELNGRYTATLTLPAASRHFAELQDHSLVLLQANPYDAPQPFRVCSDGRSSRMETTLQLQHISYDLDGYPVRPFTAATAQAAVNAINTGKLVNHPFTLSTDVIRARSMEVTVPTVARALLGEHDQSLLRRYGGELRFDRYSVQLLQSRGADRGFAIEYGKNLVDLKQERNLSELYTGVLPYWSGSDTVVYGSVRPAPGTFPVSRILPVDLSSYFDSAPTAAQLDAMGDTYIAEEHIGVPEVSLTLTCVPPGARGLQQLEQLQLGDTVTVEFAALGISVRARVVAYTWDVLRERYTSLEIGTKQETAASALSDASRLTRGTLDAARIGGRSIGGGALKLGSVSDHELGDNSVTVNKIVNGAVQSVKIADGAVTESKVLNEAIAYAKLSHNVQVMFTDILAAQTVFANFIHADDGAVIADWLQARTGLTVAGWTYYPQKPSTITGDTSMDYMRILTSIGPA